MNAARLLEEYIKQQEREKAEYDINRLKICSHVQICEYPGLGRIEWLHIQHGTMTELVIDVQIWTDRRTYVRKDIVKRMKDIAKHAGCEEIE